jgi:disulfide oxidoreductase YuzD
MAKKIFKKYEIKWLNEPEEHDYPAAESYLNLIYDLEIAGDLVKQLEQAAVSMFKAKDIFRASNLSLLGVSNSHVKKDKQKIQKGTLLSPLLLVRDKLNGKVIIADGYHRMCAVYAYDEDAIVPCKII